MSLQYREVIGGEVRAIGDESMRQIEAKVCSYGVAPDTYNTTWSPGCFRSGLDQPGGMPAVCWSHQPDSIIGSVTDYRDDTDGLYVRMQLADFNDVPKAREAYSLVRDGHVKGWSFGFVDGETEKDPDYDGALRFRSAKMYEVSPVLRASVPLTKTVAVRSAAGDALAATDVDLERVIAAGIRSAMDSGEPVVIDNDDRAHEAAQNDDSIENAVLLEDVIGRPDLEPLIRAIEEANAHARSLADGDELREVLEVEDEGIRVLAEALGMIRAAFADPKNKRYPINNHDQVETAWATVNHDDNAGDYPLNGVTLESVRNAIRRAAKTYKVNLTASKGSSAGMSPSEDSGDTNGTGKVKGKGKDDSTVAGGVEQKKKSRDIEDEYLETRMALMELGR